MKQKAKESRTPHPIRSLTLDKHSPKSLPALNCCWAEEASLNFCHLHTVRAQICNKLRTTGVMASAPTQQTGETSPRKQDPHRVPHTSKYLSFVPGLGLAGIVLQNFINSGPAASIAPWEQGQLHVGWAGVPQQSFQGLHDSLLELLGAGANLQHTDCLGLFEV